MFDTLSMARSQAGTVLFISSTLQAKRARVLISRDGPERAGTQFLSLDGWVYDVRAVSIACQAGRKGSALFLPEALIVDMRAEDEIALFCPQMEFGASCRWGTGGPAVNVNFIPELEAAEIILPEVPVLDDVLETGLFDDSVEISEKYVVTPDTVETAAKSVPADVLLLERPNGGGEPPSYKSPVHEPPVDEPRYDLSMFAPGRNGPPEESWNSAPRLSDIAEEVSAATIVEARAYAPLMKAIEADDPKIGWREKAIDVKHSLSALWPKGVSLSAARARIPSFKPATPKLSTPKEPLFVIGVVVALLASAGIVRMNTTAEPEIAQRPDARTATRALAPIEVLPAVPVSPVDIAADSEIGETEIDETGVPEMAEVIEPVEIEAESSPTVDADTAPVIAEPVEVVAPETDDISGLGGTLTEVDIELAQTYLVALQLYSGKIDGKFGGQTLSAVDGFRVLYGVEQATFDIELIEHMAVAVAAREALETPQPAPVDEAPVMATPAIESPVVETPEPVFVARAPDVPVEMTPPQPTPASLYSAPLYSDPVVETAKIVPEPVATPTPTPEPVIETPPTPAPDPVIVREEITKAASLIYPEVALNRRRVPDDVAILVRYDVDLEGNVVNAEIQPGGYDGTLSSVLEAAALEAIQGQTYSPRTEDGVAVPVTGIVRRLRFQKE